MQVFEILKGIETRLIIGNNSLIKDIINQKKVYLVTDDNSRKIYILKGEKSTLVYYLIAQRLAKDIRKSKRGFYSIVDIKDKETSSKVLEMINDDTGSIKEYVNTELHPEDDPLIDPQNTNVVQLKTDPAWRQRLSLKNMNIFEEKSDIQRIFKQIESTPLNSEYNRELVVVDSSIYIIKENLTNFFLERKVEREFEKLGNLTEGIFFYPDYSSRFIIKGEHIQAIEFLRKEDGSRPKKSGKINAPILFIERITHERPLDHLLEAFNIPKDEPIDDLIQRIKDADSEKEDDSLSSSLDSIKKQ